MERKFPGKYVRKFGYTSRGYLFFFSEIMQILDFLFSASFFGRHRPECYCLSRHTLAVLSFSMRGIIIKKISCRNSDCSRFGYFSLVLVRVCLGFFKLMDYVDSCEIRSDFTCKMQSEIDIFDVKCEIDDIPYQYLRVFCENCNLSQCWKAKHM